MKKKVVATLLAASMVLGMTACGGSDNSAESKGNDKATEEGSTDEKKEDVTLRFLCYETGKEAVQKTADMFMEEHPEIKVEVVAATDMTVMNQNAIAAHQANDDYDVMWVNHVDTLAYIQGGIIQSLQEFMDADSVDYSSVLFESLLEQGMSEGATYAVPINTGTRVIACNKDLFEKYNVEYPTTQEEMLAAAEKLTVDGNYGYVNTLTENCYNPTYEQGIFMVSDGGRFYEMEDGKAVAKLDTPQMRRFLQFNLDLLQYMPKDALTMTGDDARKAFSTGNIGMYKYGNWELDLMPETDFEYELIKVPVAEAGLESGSTGGGFQIAMGAGTAHPQEAWELIKYITTTPEAMTVQAGADLPTMPQCFEMEPYNDPKYDIFKEQLDNACLTGIPVPNMNAVTEEFFKYWTDMLYGKITVEEACTEGQAAVQKLLDENYK